MSPPSVSEERLPISTLNKSTLGNEPVVGSLSSSMCELQTIVLSDLISPECLQRQKVPEDSHQHVEKVSINHHRLFYRNTFLEVYEEGAQTMVEKDDHDHLLLSNGVVFGRLNVSYR